MTLSIPILCLLRSDLSKSRRVSSVPLTLTHNAKTPISTSRVPSPILRDHQTHSLFCASRQTRRRVDGVEEKGGRATQYNEVKIVSRSLAHKGFVPCGEGNWQHWMAESGQTISPDPQISCSGKGFCETQYVITDLLQNVLSRVTVLTTIVLPN